MKATGNLIIAFLLLVVLPIVSIGQNNIPQPDIKWKETGKIQPRKASAIKASYLGIGCEVLDRDFASYDSYKEYLGNLGVKHARFQSGWAKTEKQKGVYDFSWLDRVIDDCLSRGIQPWMNTVYGNPVYEGGGDMQSSSKLPYTEEALKAWDAYIRKLVTHFQDRIFEWEIWNEIDHTAFKASSPEQYVDFYIRTAEIIREIQPKSKIIALAIAYVGDTEFIRKFFNYMKDKEKLHLVDKVTFHGYPTNPDTGFEKTEALFNLLKEYNERIEAFQGETGSPSTFGTSGALANFPFTELKQAKWDTRRALAHIGRGIPFSLFTLSEFNYPGNRLNTKGKLKIDVNLKVVHVKQSYYAYQNLTSIFDSKVIALDPGRVKIHSDSASVIYAFSDRKKDPAVIAYWDSGRAPSDLTTTHNATVTLKGTRIKTPVLIDVRTGIVYEVTESGIRQNGKDQEFLVPVYDSPLLICEKKFLLKRGLL